MTKPDADIRLLFSWDETGGSSFGAYCHPKLRAVVMEDSQPRNVSFSEWSPQPGSDLDGLVITAQGTGDHGSLYAWRANFDATAIGSARAASMLKVLRKIERALEKADETDGRPETFAQYAIRVARAIGAKGFVFKVGEGRGGLYSDNEYRLGGADELRYVVNERFTSFRKRYGKMAEAS